MMKLRETFATETVGPGTIYLRDHSLACEQATKMYQRRFLRPVGAVAKGKVSPMLTVPTNIILPEFAASGKPLNTSHIMAKYHHSEFPKLRQAARLARKMLEFSLALAQPGISTDEIDRLAHDEIVRCGAYPTPLNYYGFPKSICTSVNEVACHGIPDSRILEEGDIISIDVSLFIDGYHGDNCGTTLVGKGDPKLQHLIDTTKWSVAEAIKTCRPGSCLSEIGGAIEAVATHNKYEVVPNFCGHGTGKYIHMDPLVLHYANNEELTLEPGMLFTIEPILAEGSGDVITWSDGWTAATKDGGWTAQIEHEVLITEDGCEVLTVLED